MIFGKNRAFLYPTKVLADTNKKDTMSKNTYAGQVLKILLFGEKNSVMLVLSFEAV